MNQHLGVEMTLGLALALALALDLCIGYSPVRDSLDIRAGMIVQKGGGWMVYLYIRLSVVMYNKIKEGVGGGGGVKRRMLLVVLVSEASC